MEHEISSNFTTSLTIRERLHLMNILPGKGSYGRLLIIKRIFDKIKFSDQEKTDFNIIETPQGVMPDKKFEDNLFEMTFSAEEMELLKSILVNLNITRELNIGNMSLFEKLVGDEKSSIETKNE